MSGFEVYFLLFIDGLVANFILGFSNELVVHSMQMFGSYDPLMMLLTSTFAAVIACAANYILGRILLNIFYFSIAEQKTLLQKPPVQILLKYRMILLTIAIIPFWGNIVSLISGFIKISFIQMLGICALVKLCYYAYIIYLV